MVIGFNKISHENISGKRAASEGAGLIGVWQQEPTRFVYGLSYSYHMSGENLATFLLRDA